MPEPGGDRIPHASAQLTLTMRCDDGRLKATGSARFVRAVTLRGGFPGSDSTHTPPTTCPHAILRPAFTIPPSTPLPRVYDVPSPPIPPVTRTIRGYSAHPAFTTLPPARYHLRQLPLTLPGLPDP